MQLEPETAGRLHSLLPLHSRGSALTGISVPSPTAADPSSSPTGRRAGQAPPSALSIEGTHAAGVPQLGRGRRGRGSWSWCSQPTSVFVPSCAGDRGPSHPDREAGGLSMGLRRGSVLPLGLGSSSHSANAWWVSRQPFSGGPGWVAAPRSPESCRAGPGFRSCLPVGLCQQSK